MNYDYQSYEPPNKMTIISNRLYYIYPDNTIALNLLFQKK